MDGHTVHDDVLQYQVLFDQLEWQYIHGAQGLRWDTTNWVGGDVNRLWVTSEGEAIDGSVGEAELKVLFGRAFSRWWEVVAGVRQDIRPSPSHTWFAVGVHGLAPHWFEIDANLYVGPAGHTAARIEAEYEVLVTNRIVLQPLVELSLSGKDDPDRGIGAGLSTGEVGFRLRYEDPTRNRAVSGRRVASESVRHCRLRQGGGPGRRRLARGGGAPHLVLTSPPRLVRGQAPGARTSIGPRASATGSLPVHRAQSRAHGTA